MRQSRTGWLTTSQQNVLIQKSHSMCECASTSVTTIHPRHPPHHRYIITRSVLDNAAHRLQKHGPLPLRCHVLPRCRQQKKHSNPDKRDRKEADFYTHD